MSLSSVNQLNIVYSLNEHSCWMSYKESTNDLKLDDKQIKTQEISVVWSYEKTLKEELNNVFITLFVTNRLIVK